jgi:hypothetical protein
MTAMKAGTYILDTVKKNGWGMNDLSVDAALNHLFIVWIKHSASYSSLFFMI